MRQEDLFFSQLTVRETLSLAAELQLPDITSPEMRDEYVGKLLFRMGLVSLSSSTNLLKCFQLAPLRRVFFGNSI